MEKTSYQEKEVSTSNTKRGQYSPRRKDTAPKVNPQLAVELIFQEIKRIEAFTKRIEDATQRKVQIDEKSLENAENMRSKRFLVNGVSVSGFSPSKSSP